MEGVARGIDCWSLEEREKERKKKKFEEDIRKKVQIRLEALFMQHAQQNEKVD